MSTIPVQAGEETPAECTAGRLELEDGSRVGVMGGGPAGSFFSYFLLDLAARVGTRLELDLYESKDYSVPGPAGCNMCGGIISESLVQTLAAEGIRLPPTVITRGIDAYVLHMDVGTVRLETPRLEMRIGAVHRGAGPRGLQAADWQSFDGYLLELAAQKGARVVRGRVEDVEWQAGRPQLRVRNGASQGYDLLAVACGVNSASIKLFEAGKGNGSYRPPATAKTYISELHLGRERIAQYFGHAMHVFLLNIPRLEFAALIPKGDYVTFCLLGQNIDEDLVRAFFGAAPVRACLPPDWSGPKESCHCSPRINVGGASEPYADRLVFLGDCGVSRLYKDGIGAAYRTAKAAAVTAVFQGIGREDFRRHFWPACRSLARDNRLGRLVFAVTRLIQKWRFARRGVLDMVRREQAHAGRVRRMSEVLWNTFTGSAPYGEILLGTMHPAYIGRLIGSTLAGNWPRREPARKD
ncbi:MAG: hypothetical protein FJ387_18820 [Verrucomicrobia bacterium]|nr:hypothetical protein [Verrucomicrobiota bacterium]